MIALLTASLLFAILVRALNMVCTLIDNGTRHLSGQNVVDSLER